MIINRGVKAVCKKCGRTAFAEEFILDSVYKLMVCPDCAKECKEKEEAAKKAIKEKEMRKDGK